MATVNQLVSDGIQLVTEYGRAFEAEYGPTGVIFAVVAGLVLLGFIRLAFEGRGR